MNNYNENVNKEKTIIFLHIPKAAGSTLNKIIAKQYQPKSIFTIDGFRVQESIELFKQLPEIRKKEIKLLQGHLKFGIHDYLPQSATYITMLRNPIERVISNYYYVRRTPKHFAYQEVTSQNMTLQEYICSGISTELDNGQTRDLAGIEKSAVGFGQCYPEMLEIAKRNIQEHFSVVGLTERFDETLILLQQTLKWKFPFYTKANVTQGRPLQEEVSKDALKIIEEYNYLDIELYKYAQERFEEYVKQPQYFSQAQLKKFQFLNEIYGRLYPFGRTLRTIFR